MAGMALAGIICNKLAATETSASSASPTNQPPAQAAPPHSDGLTTNYCSGGIWDTQIGYGFRKGANEVGLSGGYAVGTKMFGTTEVHDLALVKLHYGRVLTDVLAKGKWYAGNVEGLTEVFGAWQVNPDQAYVVGFTPVLRYDFATGTRLVPFFDAGAGVSLTDIGHPDLGGLFQFNLQTGPGVHWFVCKDTVVTAQYRLLHISNASIEDPDHGVNTFAFYFGVSRFF